MGKQVARCHGWRRWELDDDDDDDLSVGRRVTVSRFDDRSNTAEVKQEGITGCHTLEKSRDATIFHRYPGEDTVRFT